MPTSLSVKLCVADLAPLQLSYPDVSRSGIIRAILYATAVLAEPLAAAPIEPPRASLWTSVSLDPTTELLLDAALKKNGAKNLSAVVYHAVRDPRALESAEQFLSLSEGARRRKIDALLLAVTGQRVGAFEEDAEADEAAPTVLLTYLLAEVSRTEKAMLTSQKEYESARGALLAYRRAMGDDRAL